MASLTSECDSNTFVGEEMQYHLSYYFFSLTTDMNRFSQTRNPRVPESQKGQGGARGVCVLFFFRF